MEQTKIKPKVGRYIYLSDETDKNLRVYAALTNETLSAVIEAALVSFLPKMTVQTKV